MAIVTSSAPAAPTAAPSATEVEPQPVLADEIVGRQSKPLPILKLRMDASTKEVHVAEESANAGETDALLVSNLRRLRSLRSLHLPGPQGILDRSNYTEVWDSTPGGLRWGEKRAKDGAWKAKWVQQDFGNNGESSTCTQSPTSSTVDEREDEANRGTDAGLLVVGRSTGVHYPLGQKWKEEWRWSNAAESGGVVKVTMKQVKRFRLEPITEEETKSVQETQDADTEEPEVDRITDDLLEVWEEIWEEAPDGLTKVQKRGHDIENNRTWKSVQELKRTNGDLKEQSSRFEELEVDTGETRGLSREVVEDGVTKSERWVSNPKTGEKWRDTWHERDGSSQKWGSKSGENSRGEQWTEKWFEQEDGKREVNHWVLSSDGKTTWGEIKGKGGDEEYGERWEKIRETDETEVETTIEKWWERPHEQVKWGENVHITKANADSQVETYEKWVNDERSEQTTDKWSILRVNGMEVEKKGTKRSHRYADGMEWGENWSQTSTVEKPEVRTSSVRDQWWRESSGNCWGDKEVVSETGTRTTEKWYQNQNGERQVDQWTVTKDGEMTGHKSGSRAGTDGGRVEWQEKWEKKGDGETAWTNKEWNEFRPDTQQHHKWGEHEQSDGKQVWKDRWGTVHAADGTRHEWCTKMHDDGLGNFQTENTGRTWRGQDVLDWFEDRHGECMGQSEKWAVKRGANDRGDNWFEKWNEKPEGKWAEKSGNNTGGDVWNEQWTENRQQDGSLYKYAKKTGKNIKGQEWTEEWIEESNNKKWAKKMGKDLGREWVEEWGEDLSSNGTGTKWTTKWAADGCQRWGQSWGDKWTEDGLRHHWGEQWSSDSGCNKWEWTRPDDSSFR